MIRQLSRDPRHVAQLACDRLNPKRSEKFDVDNLSLAIEQARSGNHATQSALDHYSIDWR